MSNDNLRTVGSEGEAQAKAYLRKSGYSVLEQNFRTRYGEIDIIARDGTDIVFVEVKLRRSSSFGQPQEAVGSKKQKRMVMAALCYAKLKRLSGKNLRFDVLSIGPEPGKTELLKAAFFAPSKYRY